MTTKPEQTAHESGLVPEAGQPQGLPSVIVDPSALSNPPAAGATPPEAESAAPAVGESAHAEGNGRLAEAAAAPEPSTTADNLEITDFEADHFASSFRASWESPEPAAAGMVQTAETVADHAAAQSNGAATAMAAEIAEPVVVPGTARRRGVMLTALAIVAFAALFAAALMSTSGPTPPTSSAQDEPAPEPVPAPAVAAKPPPPPPEPPPSAEPVPAVPAAPELAAAPAGAAAPVLPVEAPAPAPVAAPEPVAAVPPPPPEPAPPPKPAVPTVHVRIEAVPPEAAITIDDQPVANPYDAEVEKSGKHRVVVTAPGHKSQDQRVSFDRRRDFVIRLRPLPPEPKPKPEAPRVAAAPRAPKARPRPPRPAPTATKPAAPSSTKGAAFVSESPY